MIGNILNHAVAGFTAALVFLKMKGELDWLPWWAISLPIIIEFIVIAVFLLAANHNKNKG